MSVVVIHVKLIKVCFAVYGRKGKAFNVEITLSATVEELKMAIFTTIQYSKFTPNDLILYLARKNGEWIDDNEQLDELLSGNVDSTFSIIRPSGLLNMYFDANFVSTPLKIHVLVQLPDDDQMSNSVGKLVEPTNMILKESVPKLYADELKYYIERGEIIQRQCPQDSRNILEKINTIYSEDVDPLRFICVEGSSGMGKSQLAFALQGDRPYYYLLATTVDDASQPMYRNFQSISNMFIHFVNLDEPNSYDDSKVLSTASLLYQIKDLWTFGFIYALLEYSNTDQQQNNPKMIHFKNEKSFHIQKCTLNDVRQLVHNMKNTGRKLPFFILDEMVPNSDGLIEKNLSAFQRNVFRSCYLVVIVMGTNSKISNLIA
ncbi:Crinkler (CRN) family protein, partial [Thraustotheca clavata]